jgi:hypothetical protein
MVPNSCPIKFIIGFDIPLAYNIVFDYIYLYIYSKYLQVVKRNKIIKLPIRNSLKPTKQPPKKLLS